MTYLLQRPRSLPRQHCGRGDKPQTADNWRRAQTSEATVETEGRRPQLRLRRDGGGGFGREEVEAEEDAFTLEEAAKRGRHRSATRNKPQRKVRPRNRRPTNPPPSRQPISVHLLTKRICNRRAKFL